MTFMAALYLLTGLLSTAIASGQVDVFNCNNLGTGCIEKYNLPLDYFYCSCDQNGSSPHLADFYTRDYYHGYQWRGFGPYGTCINLPSLWDRNGGSMKAETLPPTVCCLYTDLNCNTIGHDWTQVNGTGSVGDFIYPYEDGVRSFQCSLWFDESSLCTDQYPILMATVV
ncbi:uncharacterized protein PAC_04499 [Phialocephala subalpina]|uniref:Uncharacterized protein n=1 Tax=Phialocephala subalpina TaxID=576137 RepID=A0A1L7WPB6_9HELO|nr:uncharacterized protein PAC_04499 [Phialocephala subalpina]